MQEGDGVSVADSERSFWRATGVRGATGHSLLGGERTFNMFVTIHI